MSPDQKSPQDKPQPGETKKNEQGPGSPMPQEGNEPRATKPGETPAPPDKKKSDDAQSPGTGKNKSEVQGETDGDRKGGGSEGGGKNANQQGVGGAGTHSPQDEGSNQSNEPGEGKVGSKAGDKAPSKQPTGSDAKQQAGQGEGTGTKKQGENDSNNKATSKDDPGEQGTPAEKPSADGTPSQQTSQDANAKSQGKTVGGGQAGEEPDKPDPVETPADKTNLEYARAQTELALEHLRDQLAKEKPELLEKLNWTKDDAKQFLHNWEQMKQRAGEKGDAGEKARKQFNDALQSLGLSRAVRNFAAATRRPSYLLSFCTTPASIPRRPNGPNSSANIPAASGGERKKTGQ